MPETAKDLLRLVGWTVLRVVRLIVYAILVTFEPLVRGVLSFAAGTGFLTTALFFFAAPQGLKVSYGVLLGLSAGCAVTLVLYELLLASLQP